MALLDAIISSSDDAIYTKSRDATITSWNPAAERLYGYTAEEAVGKPVAMIVPPARAGEDVMVLGRILRGERVEHYETERLRKDGRIVRVSLTVSPLREGDGTISGASIIARDITDRHAADEGRALLAAIVDASDDAIYAKSRAGVLTTWNAAAERLYGYTAEEAIGRPVAMLIPEHRTGEDTVVLARILGGERVEHFETERRAKDWSLVHVSVSASPVRTSDGTIIGASIVARDIRQRMADDAERARYLAMLEDYNAIIAHDLTEPLRTIDGFAEWLEVRGGDSLDGRAKEGIAQIRAAARRMHGLVEGLRQYARLGAAELHPQRVALADVVEETVAALRERISEAGAEVHVGELPEIEGDPVLLGQLMQNLISNAVKFRGEAAPEISVGAYPDGVGRWVVHVDDNGIGLAPAAADQVFGLYQRLHPREHYEGEGVGMPIARQIAERHGGRLWYEPCEAGGTRFCVSLPAARSTA